METEGPRMAEKRTIEIEVLRYNPEKDAAPHFQSFQVPFTDDTSVLQGLLYIKDHLDGSLTFRWSCRMAICGSCGKMVNGKPELSCHTFLRDYYPGKVRIEPLNHFPVVRDLVIDQTDFFDKKLPSIKPYIVPKEAWDALHSNPLDRPSLLGHLLNFVDSPNRYGIEGGFYEIHVWAFEDNRKGALTDWNPDVTCERQPIPRS